MADSSLDIPMMAPDVAATLEQTHVMFKGTPKERPLFAYRLAVPRTWAFSEAFGPVPEGPLASQGLGFFAGSAAPEAPVIAVTVTAIPFDVPVDAWMRMAFAAEGWTVVSAKWFPGAQGVFFDVTGTRVRDGVEEVRRTSARADGSHLFCVNCLTGRQGWEQAKKLFWIAHDTFKLEKPTGIGRMEPWLSAVGRNPDFGVAYPISWSATPVEGAPEGVSAVDLRLLNARQDTLLAYAQVKVQRLDEGEAVPPLDQLSSRALEKLAGFGFVAAGPRVPLTDENDPRAAAVPGWLGGLLVDGRVPAAEATARLGFAERQGCLITWQAVCPTLHDDLLVALRAQRLFEIVRATLRFD
jgi:hypothetical protein